MRLDRERVLAYALALVAPIVAVIVKSQLDAAVGADLGYVVSFAAIIVVALVGGLGPGIVATVTAAILETALFARQSVPDGGLSAVQEARFFLFVLDGVLLSWLAEIARRGRRSSDAARTEAETQRRSAEEAITSLESLQDLTARLARAATTVEVAAAVLEHARHSLQPAGGAVYVLAPDGNSLRTIDSLGYDLTDIARWRRIPLDTPVPAVRVVRDGSPIYGTAEDRYRRRFPHAQADVEPTVGSLAILPLRIGGMVSGAVGWWWLEPAAIGPAVRERLATIASLTSQALDRARAFEAEQEARESAERARERTEGARRRTAVLAEAGRALGLSLEYEATVQQIARLALPTLGDHCIVDIVGPVPERLVAALDPAEQADVEIVRRHPVDATSDNPIAAVIRDPRPLRIDLDDRVLQVVAQDEQHLAALRRFSLGRALVVPLLGHGGPMGAMLFGTRDLARLYDDEDVVMAQALAQRVARAIENVRLHLEVRRLAEQERDRVFELESVIASLGEGIVVIDRDGSVRSINAAALRLLDGPVADAAGLRERVGGGLVIGSDANGHTGPSEHLVSGTDARWVEITTYPIGRPETAPAYVCVVRDVTAFRQGQSLREAFLSLLSHELRTPVTTIYGGASVLGRPKGALADDVRQEILADVAAEADRLYRLVEDLLVLARFDEGISLGEEPNLLQRLVPPVVAQEQDRWPHVRFEVIADPDVPTVSGDETAIVQVVRNLVANAAKYSPAGTRVEVRLETAGGGARVRVLDEGSGIREQEADHLFDPFYRSPATAAMASGAGIGLYVCRRLVDAMGGRIWGMPRAGIGSEFGFELPVYQIVGDDDEIHDAAPPLLVTGHGADG